MNLSIKWKVISIFVLLQIVILSGIGLYLSANFKDFTLQQMDKYMSQEIQLLEEMLGPYLVREDENKLQQLSHHLADQVQGRITVIRADGKVLADSEEDPVTMENHGQRPEIRQAAKENLGWATRYSSTLDINMKYIAKEIDSDGYIRLAVPITRIQRTLWTIFSRLLIGFIIAFILFFILAWKVSEGISKPLERITNTAKKIAGGSLSERIHIYTKDEIGTLSRMFNLMAYKLEDTINKISSEKERLATILETMADGLIALDRGKNVLLFNSAAAKMFGLSKEVEGKLLIEVNRNQQLSQAVDQVYETGQLLTIEIQLHFPQENILRTHLAPIIHQGEVHGLVIIFTDITELRRLERLRTEFVGNVSHELKTPLTSIKGYVETLEEMDFAEPIVKRFLGVINRESDRLSRLINDLLDLSRLESRKHYQLGPQHLGDLILEIVDFLAPRAREKEIALETELPDFVPLVLGVEEQLRQVLINLIDNGIKYTPEGGWVKVSLETEADWVVLKVADDGLGIPEEDLERIFERFYRVEKARSRQMGGTGLGLSIVKHIVKAHQGEIQVDSQVGKGTTFTLKFHPVERKEDTN